MRGAFLQVSPSVVEVRINATQSGDEIDVYRDDPSEGRETRPQICSGFPIDAEIVVTADCDPVPGAEIDVRIASGARVDATFVGRDEVSGLRVYRVASGHLVPLHWARVEPRTGEWTAVVGYAFGLGPIISTGVVSSDDLRLARYPFGVMFIDVAAEKGMQGAAVTNLSGEVVGVVSGRYASQTGGSRGYAVAIPAAEVRRIVEAIVNH
jgi:serine protease Do